MLVFLFRKEFLTQFYTLIYLICCHVIDFYCTIHLSFFLLFYPAQNLDVKSIGRIFIGLVKCGAWGCFDEFNRLEPPVLSAVSMQIQVIQDAIKNKARTMELLSKSVRNCLFILFLTHWKLFFQNKAHIMIMPNSNILFFLIPWLQDIDQHGSPQLEFFLLSVHCHDFLRKMALPCCFHHNFEFRVVLLDRLLPKARDPSLPC